MNKDMNNVYTSFERFFEERTTTTNDVGCFERVKFVLNNALFL